MNVLKEQLYKENASIAALNRHLKNSRLKLYIALESVNFLWCEKEVEEFVEMWNKGFSLEEIADYFQRPAIEVLLLFLDQSEKGKVGARKGSIFGYELPTKFA